MRRILLIGQDPLIAWALEKKIAPLGFHLEHVYTLTEAKLRMRRFHYDALLLDGLARDEQEIFTSTIGATSTIIVLDDVREPMHAPASNMLHLKKEEALSTLVSSLKEVL